MRRNYCWLATLAAWTLLAILRNPLAQEEPRDNPAKRFIDKDDTIYATSAGPNVPDGKSLQDTEESYRREIAGNSPTPEELSKNWPDGEAEAKDNAKDAQEVNAEDVHANSTNISTKEEFVSEAEKSLGEFRGGEDQRKSTDIHGDSKEVKKDINFRKRSSSGKYDREKFSGDTRFSIWTSYGKTRGTSGQREMDSGKVEDSYERLTNKQRSEEIGASDDNQDFDFRFLESTGNTDDKSRECVECKPWRIDSMVMAVRGERQYPARDKSESKGDKTIHEQLKNYGLSRKADAARKSRISLTTGKGQASYLHGRGLKLKMSRDGGLMKEIVGRGNFERKRSLPLEENWSWVIGGKSRNSKALGSSGIFHLPIKSAIDEPSTVDSHKAATPADTTKLFYRQKRNFRSIDEPRSLRYLFAGNSGDVSAWLTPRDIATGNGSQSVNTEGASANPPGSDSSEPSQHKEGDGKKSSLALTNHSPRSKSRGHNSVGVFRPRRFDEKQPAIELDSIAAPSDMAKSLIGPRVITHQHGDSANIKKFPRNFRQLYGSGEYEEGGEDVGGGVLRGRRTIRLSRSIDIALDLSADREIKGKDRKERRNVDLSRRKARGGAVGWENSTTTGYVEGFFPADDTSSSGSGKMKNSPPQRRPNGYISRSKSEVSRGKSRRKAASLDKDNNVPVSASGDDETEASIYTGNTEKNGLTEVDEFQRELAARKMHGNHRGEIAYAPRDIDSRTSMKVTNGSAGRQDNWPRLTNSSFVEDSYTKPREPSQVKENVAEIKEYVNETTLEGINIIGDDVLLTTEFPLEAAVYEENLVTSPTQIPDDSRFSTVEEIYPDGNAHGPLKEKSEQRVILSKENPPTSKLNISGRFLTAPREVAEMNGRAQSILRTTSGNTSGVYSRMHFSPTRSIDVEMQPAMEKSRPNELPPREDDGKINGSARTGNGQFLVSVSSWRRDEQLVETTEDARFYQDPKDQGTLRNQGYNNVVELVDKYIRLRKESHLGSYEKTNLSAAVETRPGRTTASSDAGQETTITTNTSTTSDEDDGERYQNSALMTGKVVAKRPLARGIRPETSSPLVAFERAPAPQSSLVNPRTFEEERPDVGSIDHSAASPASPASPPTADAPIQLHRPSEFSPSRDFVNYPAGLQRSSETPITTEQAIIHLRDRFEGSSIIRAAAFINNEDVSAKRADIESSGEKCRIGCPRNFVRSFGRRHVTNSSRQTDHSSQRPTTELIITSEGDSWLLSNESTDPTEISSSPTLTSIVEPSARNISAWNLSATTNKYGQPEIESTTSAEYSDVYLTVSSNGPPDNTSSAVDPWRVNGERDNSSSTEESTAVDQWPVKHNAVVEGDLVLGGLMMVHEREETHTCGPVMPQGGVQALEAMLYTLDKLNDRNIVPGVKIGAHILDDCDKDTYGLEMAVDFIKGSISNIDGAEYHCNRTAVRKVISGVVGAASSVTSIQVANLLRLFRIPQVSFFSTSPELSNKQRFEYFTRTIPSDHYQVKAMVDIVRKMGWSYISIIYEESNYGIKAFEELEELLKKHQICIAIKEKLVKDSGVAEETAYDNIVLKLLTKPRARGCIIFGSDQEVAGVMRAVRRCNATGAFSWIGSDGWSARGLVSDGNEPEVEGTLSVQPQANPVRGFEEYFLNLTVENNRRNPWFVEFWEDHFQCRYPNASLTPYNKKYTRTCTTRERLTKQNTAFEDQLQFVSDAVMAFAYAFRDMHRDLCGGKAGLCEPMKPTKGTELLKYLRKVDFEGLSGDKFKFDKNGDGPARYNIIHFKQTSPGKYKWIRVGKYLEGELRLNMSEIQFKLGHPQPPESVCSLPCEVGQAKKYVEGEKCCWHCFNCTQYQIRDPDDETQCIACRQGTVPDETHSTCRDIPEEFLRPGSGWAIGAMSFSATGILVTLCVVGVFLRHNDTPVVRASGRELSYVLLSGILLCYLVTFALVLRPSDIVCGIQRFTAGFCFTVVYAALLTKTNRILRIFNASKRSAKRPSFISPRSQLIICSGLVGVQILINGVWMVIDPARAMHHYPTREDNLLVCNSYIDASYMIAFTYPIILIVVCTVYAVLTRKTPEAFNESKHIGFTMYTTCVIWLAFVPLYFGTGNHVALRITSMSVTISLSASVTIACLFSPKLYIILIRPERNVRQSMMPTRYSTTKNSAMSGTNASSTLGPIALTSVTCGQNEALRKHVRTTIDGSTQSEHHELEVISKKNGKVPAAVVTRSTQTQTNNNENDGDVAATEAAATAAVKEPKQINRIGNGPIAQNDLPS